MTTLDQTRNLRSDARRNREAVVAAADRLFRDDGVELQMPDVAKAAGVGVGTVYRHFPHKEDLIAALIRARFELLALTARECLALADPWQGLTRFIRLSAEIQANDRGMCDAHTMHPELMGPAAQAAGLPELCRRLVRRAQRDGSLRRDLTWEDIPMISCGLGSAMRQPIGAAPGRWPRLLEIVIDGLRSPGSGRLPRPG